ncbi:MAG: aminotransferase class V-fold PLP-dependent enzyme, partial [Myxococcales bacterium]|nr:aminotransferase class V-fold PLP-dependent enzyme [Myxococcales bacterium]
MSAAALDVGAVRAQFPILGQTPHGKPLVYLDSAATTQKPRAVLDALQHHYAADNANIHRAVYQLGERATQAYEAARADVAAFLNAPESREIIFTRGATEALNLVAHSFLAPRLKPGQVVLVGALEHHANIVPWQMVGARTVPIPVDAHGDLDLAEYARLLDAHDVALVAIGWVSNAIGTVNPVGEIIAQAKARGLPVVVDGAQAVPHQPVDLRALGADFFAFSGHKLYAPTGIGVLWGKADLLNAMRPYQGGGDM